MKMSVFSGVFAKKLADFRGRGDAWAIEPADPRRSTTYEHELRAAVYGTGDANAFDALAANSAPIGLGRGSLCAVSFGAENRPNAERPEIALKAVLLMKEQDPTCFFLEAIVRIPLEETSISPAQIFAAWAGKHRISCSSVFMGPQADPPHHAAAAQAQLSKWNWFSLDSANPVDSAVPSLDAFAKKACADFAEKTGKPNPQISGAQAQQEALAELAKRVFDPVKAKQARRFAR
jgi:hypothetical protein